MWLLGVLATSLSIAGTEHIKLLFDTYLSDLSRCRWEEKQQSSAHREHAVGIAVRYLRMWESDDCSDRNEGMLSNGEDDYGNRKEDMMSDGGNKYEPIRLPQSLRTIHVDGGELGEMLTIAACLEKHENGSFVLESEEEPEELGDEEGFSYLIYEEARWKMRFQWQPKLSGTGAADKGAL